MDLWEQDLDFLFLNIWATIFEAGASRNVSRPAFLENPAKQLQDKHISGLNRSPDHFFGVTGINRRYMDVNSSYRMGVLGSNLIKCPSYVYCWVKYTKVQAKMVQLQNV